MSTPMDAAPEGTWICDCGFETTNPKSMKLPFICDKCEGMLSLKPEQSPVERWTGIPEHSFPEECRLVIRRLCALLDTHLKAYCPPNACDSHQKLAREVERLRKDYAKLREVEQEQRRRAEVERTIKEAEKQILLDEVAAHTKTKADLTAAREREAKLREAWESMRDSILHGRGPLEDMLDSNQTNAVLAVIDEAFAATKED